VFTLYKHIHPAWSAGIHGSADAEITALGRLATTPLVTCTQV